MPSVNLLAALVHQLLYRIMLSCINCVDVETDKSISRFYYQLACILAWCLYSSGNALRYSIIGLAGGVFEAGITSAEAWVKESQVAALTKARILRGLDDTKPSLHGRARAGDVDRFT